MLILSLGLQLSDTYAFLIGDPCSYSLSLDHAVVVFHISVEVLEFVDGGFAQRL